MQRNYLGLLHPRKFRHKPAGADIGQIKHELLFKSNLASMTPEEWLKASLAGQTIEPGRCIYPDQDNIPAHDGTREEYFKGQSFFFVDIDNELEQAKAHGADENTPLETPASYKAKLGKYGIKPNFGYYSMSSEEWNGKKGKKNPQKFRVAIFTDSAVTNAKEVKRILNGLINLSDFADRQPSNVSSIFFGTNKGEVLELRDFEAVTPLDNLLELAKQAEQVNRQTDSMDLKRDENGNLIIPPNFVIYYLTRNNTLFKWLCHELKLYGKERTEKIKDEYLMLATQFCNPAYDLNNYQDKRELDNTFKSALRYAEDFWNREDYKPYDEFIKQPTAFDVFEDESLNDNEPSSNMTAQSINNQDISQSKPDRKLEDVLKQADRFNVDWIGEIRNEIFDESRGRYIPTGIDELDEILGGGFYPGLVVLGAETGIGKTTLALQIADHLAFSGHDVLFFALEMSRTELFSRSISRMSHLVKQPSDDDLTDFDYIPVFQAQEVRSAQKKKDWNEEKKETLDSLIKTYENTIARHIKFICGLGDISSHHIEKAIEKHMSQYAGLSKEERIKHTPFIVVDYLQILDRGNATNDKEKTDRAVMAVKRIASKYDIPVLVISSFNRMNYKEQVDLSAFKESGSIEYTADVVLALQLDGMDLLEDDKHRTYRINRLKTEAEIRKREGKPIWLELKVLKNRSGETGTVPLDFTARYNYFETGDKLERRSIRAMYEDKGKSDKGKKKRSRPY